MYWDPFEELRRIQQEIDRMFATLTRYRPKIREPLVDVLDEGESFRIIVDLPGMRKEDIEVYVEEDKVVIKAERKAEDERKGENYFVRERSYAQFYRVVPLPEPVVPEQAKAKYNNGVLEIVVPKAGKAEKGHRVQIE